MYENTARKMKVLFRRTRCKNNGAFLTIELLTINIIPKSGSSPEFRLYTFNIKSIHLIKSYIQVYRIFFIIMINDVKYSGMCVFGNCFFLRKSFVSFLRILCISYFVFTLTNLRKYYFQSSI
jgi:hypothetical protein